jgi:hypothetical protein
MNKIIDICKPKFLTMKTSTIFSPVKWNKLQRLTVIVILFTFATALHSQTPDTAQMHKEMRNIMMQMNIKTQLTPQQQAKMRPVVEEYVKTSMQNRENLHTTHNMKDYKKASSEALNKFTDGQKSVMTPAQYEKWKDMGNKKPETNTGK